MSKLQAWVKKHEKPFAVRAKNGKGTVSVEFLDGYVTVVGTQPGLRGYETRIHLTRSAWLEILRQVARPTRLMEGPDFDAHRAEREYLRMEQAHVQALREEKKDRRRPEAQRERFARAKARAQRKAAATD